MILVIICKLVNYFIVIKENMNSFDYMVVR